ncbi:MAG: GIY-YIG nuclease family protein [bacterium]
MKTYTVDFNGYWGDEQKNGIPSESGIYLVYRCKINEQEKKVNLKEIIYIGQSSDVCERLSKHEKYSDFQKQLLEDESLCYSYASVPDNELNIIENALVNMQQPQLNEQYKDYSHGPAIFMISGMCGLLKMKNFSMK